MQETLTDLESKILALCKRDGKYESILYSIAVLDERYRDDQFGFQFVEVPGFSGAHVNTLLQEGILKYGYKSSNATHFKLAVDRDELKTILSNVEQTRKEAEQQHIETERRKETMLPIQLVERFEKLLADGTDMLEYWNGWINPKIEGMSSVKKALLLSMASHGDRFGDRGRIHVLMHGDPGGAKSTLMSWIVYQIGANLCSQRTSKVGLTGDASGEDIVPGALPKSHKGILCIDELDKFAHKDRQGLLESMEEGKVHIDVGKFSVVMDSEVRAIASANRIDDFSPELLDRFDFKFELKAPGGNAEKKIACAIIDHWFETKEGYDGFDLKNYLKWIYDFEPTIPLEVRDKIKLLVCMYLDLDECIRGSPRKKESLMRVAFTIAKLHKRNVCVKDFLTAIKVLNPNLNSGKVQALEQLAAMK